MITNAILNFVFGFFDIIFSKLPIPDIPDWCVTAMGYVNEWISRGCSLIMWIFPHDIYPLMIDILSTLLTVRVMYDIYNKFHHLKVST